MPVNTSGEWWTGTSTSGACARMPGVNSDSKTRTSVVAAQVEIRPSLPFMWLLDILADGARACDRVVRDIHLAHEADARVRLCIQYEILEHSHTSGPACDTVVRADRHHATAMRAFFIQHVAFALQVGCVGFGAEVACLVVHN